MASRGSLGKVAQQTTQKRLYVMLLVGLAAGYLLGTVVMETADVMFNTAPKVPITHPGGQVTQQTTQSQTTTQPQNTAARVKPAGDTIHSLLTSNGSPYQNIQGRIMYATYQLVQKMPGGEKLTGFTRILHRSTDDLFMDEMPTYRVQPLHPECDIYCDFPVADRPNAVQQWINAAEADPNMIKGAWVFLIEADYVWMKPFQAPDMYSGAPGMQFLFDYIMPTYPGVPETLQRLAKASGMEIKGAIKDVIPCSGPAPALLRFEELKKVTPLWEVITANIEKDADAKDRLGWIREMYAWDLAIHGAGVNIRTEAPPVSVLLAQPPHDKSIGPAAICHYTWGAIYNDTKGTVFSFEKREWTSQDMALKIPLLAMPPQPFQPNTWHLQGKEPVTQDIHETMTAMIGQMNKGIANLRDLSSRKVQARRALA